MEGTLFVTRETAYRMLRDVMMLATKVIPADVKAELERMHREEASERARLHLEVLLENRAIAEREDVLACPDTGSMLYYVRAGDIVRIQGGFSAPSREGRRAVTDLTAAARLRPNMVLPLTHKKVIGGLVASGCETCIVPPGTAIQEPRLRARGSNTGRPGE